MGQWQRNGSLLGKTSADCQEIPSLSERFALFGGLKAFERSCVKPSITL
jgi:hypothetical protein